MICTTHSPVFTRFRCVSLIPPGRLRRAMEPKTTVGGSNAMPLKKLYGERLQTPPFPCVLTNAIGRGTGPSKYGFAAAKGWDAASGLGTPNFPRLLAAALKEGLLVLATRQAGHSPDWCRRESCEGAVSAKARPIIWSAA